MKKTLLLALIIIITFNANAQINDMISPKRHNIACYDSLFVYKNLALTKTYLQQIFIVEDSDKLYINDLKLKITHKEKVLLGDDGFYRLEYDLLDDKNNKYNLGMYFGYGLPYQGGLIDKGSDMRYGFSRAY